MASCGHSHCHNEPSSKIFTLSAFLVEPLRALLGAHKVGIEFLSAFFEHFVDTFPHRYIQ